MHAIFYFSITDENVHMYYIFFLEGQIITVTDPKTGESIQQIIQTIIDPKTGKPKQIKTPINAGNDFLMKKPKCNFINLPPTLPAFMFSTFGKPRIYI